MLEWIFMERTKETLIKEKTRATCLLLTLVSKFTLTAMGKNYYQILETNQSATDRIIQSA